MNDLARCRFRADERIEARTRRWTAIRAEMNQLSESLVHLEEQIGAARVRFGRELLTPPSEQNARRAAALLEAEIPLETLERRLAERVALEDRLREIAANPVSDTLLLERLSERHQEVAKRCETLRESLARFDFPEFAWLEARWREGAQPNDRFARFWQAVTLLSQREERAIDQLVRRTGHDSIRDAITERATTAEKLRSYERELRSLTAPLESAENAREESESIQAKLDRFDDDTIELLCDPLLEALASTDVRTIHLQLRPPEELQFCTCHALLKKHKLLEALLHYSTSRADAFARHVAEVQSIAIRLAEADTRYDALDVAKEPIAPLDRDGLSKLADQLFEIERFDLECVDPLQKVQNLHHALFEFDDYASYRAFTRNEPGAELADLLQHADRHEELCAFAAEILTHRNLPRR